MIPPILAAILGLAPQGPGQPSPQSANAPQATTPAPAPAPVDSQAVPPDIVSQALPTPSLHQGILHGIFGVGHTGGNILGALGDAFLTQAGHAPQYAPRLQQARAAEALKSYASNPEDALSQYIGVNAPDALHQFDVFHDNTRQQAASDSIIADNKQNRELKTRGLVGSMIYAANDKTWPDMKKRAQAYAAANGLDEVIPDDIDSAKAWASGSESIGDQNRNAALAAYRQQMIDLRNRTEADKKEYYSGSLKVRQQQAQTGQQRADQQGSYQGMTAAERERHDKANEDYNNAHPRGASRAGTGAAGAPTWDPVKGKYVFK